LDGLRAVAILLVVAFHVPIPGASLGWSGVWVFFVISGFLITGILLDAKGDPHYYKNFYARRALRIMPIYYLSLVGLVAATACGAWFKRIGGVNTHYGLADWPWFAFYAQNYCLGANQFRAQFPLHFGHTWSLAVEEQFYLLWPLAVRCLSLRAVVRVSVALVIAAPAARFWLVGATGNPFLAFTPLICNVDGLALGALVAALTRSQRTASVLAAAGPSLRRWVRLGLLAVGVGTAAVVLAHGPGCYWQPRNYLSRVSANLLLTTLFSAFSALLLIEAVFFAGPIAAVLAWRPLRHIGKISYGIYLYHWPIFVVLPRLAHLDPERQVIPCAIVNLAGTYAVALASWHLIERPCLRLKDRFSGARSRAADCCEAGSPCQATKAP
jgi:peptidoglycan/LPS O-acetylase OafA/YrhL